METKKIVGRDLIIYYPRFSEIFIIHIYAIKINLGEGIGQNEKTANFYSCKLIPEQINYTTTEREMLGILETLK